MQNSICCEIISTGSELMMGNNIDTNSAWLSQIMTSIGVKVVRHTAVGDDLARLCEAFKSAWEQNDVIIVTGGLGPTEDDITRKAVSETFDLELEFHDDLALYIKNMFSRRGYSFTENNIKQAHLPKGALLINNHWGTAPGFALESPKHLMSFLPGVPMEMKKMTENWVLPKIKEKFKLDGGLTKTTIIKTVGLGESVVDDAIKDLTSKNSSVNIGLLASHNIVKILLTSTGKNADEADALAAPVLNEIKNRLEKNIYGYGDTSLPEATADLLKAQGFRLAIIDTATQGRLSGSLAPALDYNNWQGSQDLLWQPVLSGAKEILGIYSPDYNLKQDPPITGSRRNSEEIQLLLTCNSNPNECSKEPDQEIELSFESAVHSESINNGLLMTRRFCLGGELKRVLSRAAVLANFHLWQVLKGFDD